MVSFLTQDFCSCQYRFKGTSKRVLQLASKMFMTLNLLLIYSSYCLSTFSLIFGCFMVKSTKGLNNHNHKNQHFLTWQIFYKQVLQLMETRQKFTLLVVTFRGCIKRKFLQIIYAGNSRKKLIFTERCSVKICYRCSDELTLLRGRDRTIRISK